MQPINFDHFVQTKTYSMNTLHSHSYYEIYFLYEGERSVFLPDTILNVSACSLLVIPPDIMHMTSGGPFKRYNINVFSDQLNEFQRELLDSIGLQSIVLTTEAAKELLRLFELATKSEYEKKFESDYLSMIFSVFVFNLVNLNPQTTENRKNPKLIPPLYLRITAYLNTNYSHKITLNELTKMFFITKTALVNNFKKYFQCTPIDYLLNIRLTHAKQLLIQTNESIEFISESCGFNSANYFGLIFKKKEGLSPLHFRKTRHTKQLSVPL